MRLQDYIFEGASEIPIPQISLMILKNCKQYLKLIKGKMPLYRGMAGLYDSGIKDVRKDRRPLGMVRNVAKELNKFLEKEGHMRRDKSFMVTSDTTELETFGEPYLVFPLDPIKGYTWMESKDANLDDPRTGWTTYTFDKWVENGANPDYQDLYMKKPFKEYFHTNTGFDTAYKNGYEMWFNCKEYYFVRYDYCMWNVKKQKLWEVL